MVADKDFRVPKLLGRGCVLQRGEKTRVWGWAPPDASVEIVLLEQGKGSETGWLCCAQDLKNSEADKGSHEQDERKARDVVARCTAKADAGGIFSSYFEGLKAGGPYTLVFSCREECVRSEDVWVGDVFVCAGQSNMELPMRRVREKYPEEFINGGSDHVHVYKVKEAYDFKQEASEHENACWNPDFAETPAFSYFLGKELSQAERVPIGILNLSLGGTPIQAWMSADALRDWPDYLKEKAALSDDAWCHALTERNEAEEAAWQKALYEKERIVWPHHEAIGEQTEVKKTKERETEEKESVKEGTTEREITDKKAAEVKGAEIKNTEKNTPDTQAVIGINEKSWHPILLPGFLSDGGLTDFCGSVLLRKKFSVPDELAGRKALLRLGTLADADRAYVNGVFVGETGYRYPPRRYTVPEGVLQAGENELLIHLVCRNGDGRMTKGKTVELAWEDVCDDAWIPDTTLNAPISLEGEWEYLVLAETDDPAPEQIFLNRGATGLFNAMVAPALAYTVKGVVWYQGESNDGKPEEYEKLLPDMISDWRKRWGQEHLPFVIVQLPNCDIDIAKETTDGRLPWPMIREAQRRAGELPAVAVTVNLDIGEDNDLHPLNKKEAARRAALALRKMVYQEDVVCSGPKLCGWETHADGLVVYFDRIVSVPGKGEIPDGLFELFCEDTGWIPARASVCQNEVWLQLIPAVSDSCSAEKSAGGRDGSGGNKMSDSAVDAASVRAIRYAWSNAPGETLLYGEEGLCVSPFVESHAN
ncbi:MAG: sialate O-acetylesterase [Lachnospiraceae bacterium]|nr:sialate O-acetylesterase [Lachnospiraceae bacterium]